MASNNLMGAKVRRLRKQHGLTQAELARRLGISASYLALIEGNQRTLTVELLIKLARELDVDLETFSGDADGRLVAELEEVFADRLFDDEAIEGPECRRIVSESPAVARAVLKLHRSWRQARDSVDSLAIRLTEDQTGAAPARASSSRMANEEVSDLVQEYDNYFGDIEEHAEQLWRDAGLESIELFSGLRRALEREHDVRVEITRADELGGAVRRFDPKSRKLSVSEALPQSSLVFQLALQIGLLGSRELFEKIIDGSRFSDENARALARTSLASYFAGAVLMPYSEFSRAAKSVRYDVELLEHRFRASFEQVCHRLSTLGRPGASGVPLHFVRIDIAGNISKRFSRSGIRFARYSGSCPRWNVHAAFLTPGVIRTQVSRMPEGKAFFCIARTVRKAGGGHRVPQSRLAIGLGCELSHARELVYSDGVDLDNEQAVVPVGTTCRLCERMDCRQRAFPPLHQQLKVDENVRGLTSYTTPDE